MLAAFDAAEPAWLANTGVDRRGTYPAELEPILGSAAMAAARQAISAWPGYAPTPLTELPGLARQLGIARLGYKDESGRFGLGSFKALGGAYAVGCALQRARSATGPGATFTVTTATDGNHGRAVAWGAQRFGCRAVIFVHAGVSAGRIRQIEARGATVVTVPGSYDDAVRAAAAAATAPGWLLIADTAGAEDLPAARDVMAGYTVLADEALRQFGATPPTHVFVQAGVGGLAAAVLACLWQRLGAVRPVVIVVEAERAACLLASARAGRAVAAPGAPDTIMAGLACGEPSLPAWRILQRGADAFAAVPDTIVAPAMRLLARSPWRDPALVAGESAVAGLAMLIRASRSPRLRPALGLGPDARCLVIGTEGDTDPQLWRALAGDPAQ